MGELFTRVLDALSVNDTNYVAFSMKNKNTRDLGRWLLDTEQSIS